MKLKRWIERTGHAQVADLLGVTIGCVSHWYTGRRVPSRDLAARIVALSNDGRRGMPAVTWEDIYSSQ